MQRVPISDIESQLLEDKTGEYRRKLINDQRAFQQWVQQKLNVGANDDEFKLLSSVKEALTVADEIISKFK